MQVIATSGINWKNGDITSLTTTIPLNVLPGDVLVVAIAIYEAPSFSEVSVSDTAGNSFILQYSANGSQFAAGFFTNDSFIGNASDYITATFPSRNNITIFVWQLRGVGNAISTVASGDTGTDSEVDTVATQTFSAPPGIVCAIFANSDGKTISSVNNNFTIDNSNISSGNESGAVHGIISATEDIAPTITMSSDLATSTSAFLMAASTVESAGGSSSWMQPQRYFATKRGTDCPLGY